jgi:hypothetical protein
LKIAKFARFLFTFSEKRMDELSAENKYLSARNFSMTDKTASNALQEEKNIIQTLRNSLMVILTLIFVLLYAAAFSGKLDPLKDSTMIWHLEPVIFVLIGYYFGRLPARENEKTLKDEITRQTQKADAAQFAKEKAQQERETLEEKIKNAKAALKTVALMETNTGKRVESLKAVVSILDS